MAWHPKKAELAIIDNTGHWGVVSDLGGVKTTDVAAKTSAPKSSTSNNVAKPTKTIEEADEDDEMLNDEEVTSKILIN